MFVVRQIDGLLAEHAVTHQNLMRLDLMKLRLGTIFHADASLADATATAADLPTVLVMANALKIELNAHMASACDAHTGQGAHVAADAVNPVVAATAVDQGTANTLLTAIKAAFNAHLTQAGVHTNNDTTSTVATADATTLGTSITLANALQAKINIHFAAAMTSQAALIVPA
jgi:hypothetical protein